MDTISHLESGYPIKVFSSNSLVNNCLIDIILQDWNRIYDTSNIPFLQGNHTIRFLMYLRNNNDKKNILSVLVFGPDGNTYYFSKANNPKSLREVFDDLIVNFDVKPGLTNSAESNLKVFLKKLDEYILNVENEIEIQKIQSIEFDKILIEKGYFGSYRHLYDIQNGLNEEPGWKRITLNFIDLIEPGMKLRQYILPFASKDIYFTEYVTTSKPYKREKIGHGFGYHGTMGIHWAIDTEINGIVWLDGFFEGGRVTEVWIKTIKNNSKAIL